MKQPLLCMILWMTVILSCSKKDAPQGDCNQVVQVFEALPEGAIAAEPFATLTYDDSARVSTVSGPGWEKRKYTYYKDSITVRTVYESGAVRQNTYWLDSEGRVVSSRAADYRFRYNAEGYLVGFQQHNGKYNQDSRYIPYTVRWEEGNLAEVSSVDPDAVVKQMFFNYYPQPHQELVGFNSPLWEGRVFSDWDLLYLVPGGYLGKSSRHLLRAARYEFDDKGRAVTMADRWAFRYGCK